MALIPEDLRYARDRLDGPQDEGALLKIAKDCIGPCHDELHQESQKLAMERIATALVRCPQFQQALTILWADGFMHGCLATQAEAARLVGQQITAQEGAKGDEPT